MLRRLAAVTQQCTDAMQSYDHAAALEQAERCFWLFCDDYLELVKARAYGEHGPDAAASAVTTLRTGLSTLLRLLAPVLPFVTEEVWSWWQDGSIHRAPWPDAAELSALAGPGDEQALTVAMSAIAAVRKAKSQAQVPMKHPVALLRVTAGQDWLTGLDAARGDVLAAGKVASLELRAAEEAAPDYEVQLAGPASPPDISHTATEAARS